MIQKIFDVENADDMAWLWDILPDDIYKVKKDIDCNLYFSKTTNRGYCELIAINWHDKTEITRPIREATEQDIGKLCYFWEEGEEDRDLGILVDIGNGDRPYRLDNRLADFAYSDELWYDHCRRLTKQEIEELC